MKRLRIPALLGLLAFGFVGFFVTDTPGTQVASGAVARPTPPPKGGTRNTNGDGDSLANNGKSNSDKKKPAPANGASPDNRD